MLLKVLLIAVLAGGVQSFKFHLKPVPTTPEGQADFRSLNLSPAEPYYSAPVYLPQPSPLNTYPSYSAYRNEEYTRPQQPIIRASAPVLREARHSHQQPQALAYLVVAPIHAGAPLARYSGIQKAAGLEQSAIKGVEQHRTVQETKGAEQHRQQLEITQQDAQRLQGTKEQAQIQQEHREELTDLTQHQEQIRDWGSQQQVPLTYQQQQQDEQADLINQYLAAKQSKMAKFKNSLSRFAAAAKAKFSIGKYEVVSEEIVPPAPTSQQQQTRVTVDEVQQLQQQQHEEADRDLVQQSTELPQEAERSEQVKGAPERQEAVKGLPERQEPVKSLPERQEPVKGLPERQEQIKTVPERQEQIKTVPERHETIPRQPERKEPVRAQEPGKGLPPRTEHVQVPKGWESSRVTQLPREPSLKLFHSNTGSEDTFVVNDAYRREPNQPHASEDHAHAHDHPATLATPSQLPPAQPLSQPQEARPSSPSVSSVSTN